MSKLSNSLTMLQLLQNKRRYSVKELAERLEVSERMIRIYKSDLEKAGIYINTIRGPYGGYILNENVSFSLRKITKEDIDLLKKLKSDNPDMKTLIDKLESVVILDNNESKVLDNTSKDKYNTFVRAYKNKIKVKINYISVDSKNVKTRIIHPLDIFLYEDGWNVSGFCELRNDIRNFNFKRILDYKILDENFK